MVLNLDEDNRGPAMVWTVDLDEALLPGELTLGGKSVLGELGGELGFFTEEFFFPKLRNMIIA